MNNLILFGLFILLLLAVQFTPAKTVEEVIEKYIKARGGKSKLDEVRSIYLEGTRRMNGKEMAISIIKEQGRLSRTEIETGIASGFVLITDREGWTHFPLRSPAMAQISGGDLAGMQTELDIAGPLVDYVEKGHTVTLLGRETVEGNACYKIKLITKEGKEMLYWLDTATFLLNQSAPVPVREQSKAGGEAFTIYRNYRAVNGIQFAHTFETKTNRADAAAVEIIFHQVLLNPPIDPKMYEPEQLIT